MDFVKKMVIAIGVLVVLFIGAFFWIIFNVDGDSEKVNNVEDIVPENVAQGNEQISERVQPEEEEEELPEIESGAYLDELETESVLESEESEERDIVVTGGTISQ